MKWRLVKGIWGGVLFDGVGVVLVVGGVLLCVEACVGVWRRV